MWQAAIKRKFHEGIRFLRGDVWRIRARDLPRGKLLLLNNVRIILLALRGFARDRCSLRASALTFFTILSIVPAVAMAFGVAKGFGMDSKLEEAILNGLKGQQEAAARIIEFSLSMLENTKGGVIAGVGIVVLFWTVIKVLTNVEKSFNAIWGVKLHRSLGRRFADYLAMMLICPVLLILSGGVTVVVTSGIKAVVEGIALLGFLAPLVELVIKLIPYGLGWVAFAFVYVFMPNTKGNLKSTLVAGIVAGTLYQLMMWAYVAFQVGVSKYNAIYGSFAALPLFLIWLQVSWLVVLFGAELSFAHQNVDTYEFEPDCLDSSRGLRRLLALRIAQMLVGRFAEGADPMTRGEISHELGVPIRLTTDILYELVGARILSETMPEGAKEAGYQPARQIGDLTLAYVLEALDKQGSDAIPLVDSPALEKLSACLAEFGETIRTSPANIALKDV